jgi:hypothetical protein
MNDITTIALFCDDIRQESAGTTTLVGVYPDSLSLPKMPGVLAKLSVYCRIHVRADYKPGRIVTRLLMPGSDDDVPSSPADEKIVNGALDKARAESKPYAGLITTFAIVGLRLREPGRMRVIVTEGEREYTAAILDLKLVPPT